MAAKTKTPPWTPPPDAVHELLDGASYRLREDEIVPADVEKPHLERLRGLLDGWLAFGMAGDYPYPDPETSSNEQTFGTLKQALLEAKAKLESCKFMQKSYERESALAAYRLENLKAVTMEMMDAYGSGSEETGTRLQTPIGDIRLQKNSQPFVWVDESRIDEIPESLGDFELVKIEKKASKTGIKAYLEDLDQQIAIAVDKGEAPPEKPTWAEVRPPGVHIRF
jgi:hypothetical protein